MTTPNLGSLTFYARTSGDEKSVMETIRAAVRKTDHALPVYDLKTMGQLLAGLIPAASAHPDRSA